MKKINYLGKLAIAAIVILAVFGVWKLTGLPGGNNAEAAITGFAASIEDMNYSFAYKQLSEEIQKNGSESSFAARIAEKFGGEKFELKKLVLEKETGYAILLMNTSQEYLTLPLIKENDEWKINYFEKEAKCVNKCTAGISCSDEKTVLDCKDSDNDGCTDEIFTPCEFECSEGACLTRQSSYTLSAGGSIMNFKNKIMLIDIELNTDEATLQLGDDIFLMKKGETKTSKGTIVTLTDVAKDKVSLRVSGE